MAEQAAAQFNSQRAATAATEDEGEQDPLTGVCVCVILCVCVCHMFRGGWGQTGCLHWCVSVCVCVTCVEEDEGEQNALTGVCACVPVCLCDSVHGGVLTRGIYA